MWEFNEIVGHIKLYFHGSQVRGEYWGTTAKRIVRTRRKQFEYKTHKLYVEKSIRNSSNEAILAVVEEYLDGCAAELQKRHIDLREFNTIKSHIDWLGLYKSTNIFAAQT